MANFTLTESGSTSSAIGFIWLLRRIPSADQYETYTDLGGGDFTWNLYSPEAYRGGDTYEGNPELASTFMVKNGVVSGGKLVAGDVYRMEYPESVEYPWLDNARLVESSYSLFSIEDARFMADSTDFEEFTLAEEAMLASIYRGDDRIDISTGGNSLLGPQYADGYGGDDWIRTGDKFDGLNGGAGNDTLIALGGRDTLNGGLGNDTLFGGDHNDVLIGWDGKDILVGGRGADVFKYTQAKQSMPGINADRITDFDDRSDDRIDISALSARPLTYMHDATFTAAGQVRIADVAGPDVLVVVNIGGTLEGDFYIRLVNTTLASMGKDDFIL